MRPTPVRPVPAPRHSHPTASGVSPPPLGEFLAELAASGGPAARQPCPRERRGAAAGCGAGPQQRLVFTDRLLVAPVHLRQTGPYPQAVTPSHTPPA
ncbi:hypothetical protein [Streptomyces sp. x-80]|uniref:hypothetical protein n=1 Tax=Streptomyces sp. x-80 TaxID=2789282 RepID=UPI00397F24FC